MDVDVLAIQTMRQARQEERDEAHAEALSAIEEDLLSALPDGFATIIAKVCAGNREYNAYLERELQRKRDMNEEPL